MLTEPAAPDKLEKWKRTWAHYRPLLYPNRRPARVLLSYLKQNYPLRELKDERSNMVVVQNVLSNDFYAEKLMAGRQPRAVAFIIENTGNGSELYHQQDDIFKGIKIFVGIDLETGFFTVEGSSLLYDKLFVLRGLDAADLENPFLVAQYVEGLETFGVLDRVLNGGPPFNEQY